MRWLVLALVVAMLSGCAKSGYDDMTLQGPTWEPGYWWLVEERYEAGGTFGTFSGTETARYEVVAESFDDEPGWFVIRDGEYLDLLFITPELDVMSGEGRLCDDCSYISTRQDVLTPPIPFPVAKGDTWAEAGYGFEFTSAHVPLVMRGGHSVQVPAGTFEAGRITASISAHEEESFDGASYEFDLVGTLQIDYAPEAQFVVASTTRMDVSYRTTDPDGGRWSEQSGQMTWQTTNSLLDYRLEAGPAWTHEELMADFGSPWTLHGEELDFPEPPTPLEGNVTHVHDDDNTTRLEVDLALPTAVDVGASHVLRATATGGTLPYQYSWRAADDPFTFGDADITVDGADATATIEATEPGLYGVVLEVTDNSTPPQRVVLDIGVPFSFHATVEGSCDGAAMGRNVGACKNSGPIPLGPGSASLQVHVLVEDRLLDDGALLLRSAFGEDMDRVELAAGEATITTEALARHTSAVASLEPPTGLLMPVAYTIDVTPAEGSVTVRTGPCGGCT